MFDISIKILSLSDAEIYFILPSVVGHVTGLYRVWTLCVIPVMPQRVSAYSAEFDQGAWWLGRLCVYGVVFMNMTGC